MSGNNTSRRSFLGAAAGLAALRPAMGGAPPAAATSDRPGEVKLGVASYSFREFSRHAAIVLTKRLNTPYINIKEFHLPIDSTPDEIRRARAEFERAGLVIVGGGNVSFQKDDEDDIRHKFEYAKLAGMPLLVCAPTHETLPKLEKYVKEYNIKIAVHNHGPEDKHFPTPQSVLEVVKNMDSRCGLCIDVGHTARTGVDVVEAVREAGPRLLDMHIKDLKNARDRASQVPVGDGVLPIPAIFRQLEKMGYTGYVNLEYEIDDLDPLPGMAKSFAYMRGVLAGMNNKG
ncbi:MAG TPA: sugar phosphate isomerase/epimerase [Bryobacteraceae bacterium]|nr:sugar phosphate isomerase/epimerase [Bryobacteraceae bacterium]